MSNGITGQLHIERPGFRMDTAFSLPAKGVTALFGPSGAGKTTLLRFIAGLERCNGRLQVGDQVWQDGSVFLPPHERKIGYVFQESSLFEHLNVEANLLYGFERSAEQSFGLDKAIDLLGLATLLNKSPAELSGGERKRVAIGRALLRNPKLLLLDEPLTSLDQARRRELLPFLETLRAEAGMPIVYVSHSPEEIARLADYVLLLDAGKVTAEGALQELLTRLDLPVAHAPDAGAVIEASVDAYDADYGLTSLGFAGGQLHVPGQPASPGEQVRVRILARDVSVTLARQSDTSILNILPAVVTAIDNDQPGQVLLKLDAGGIAVLSRITQKSCQALNIEIGTSVFAQIKTVALL